MNTTSAAEATQVSLASAPLLSRPLLFVIRLTITSVAVLSFAQLFSANLVERLLPAFRAAIYRLDDNITIFSLNVVQEDLGNRVRLRGNLWRPIYINHSVVYPMGWKGRPNGGYQVHLNVGGVLESSLLLLIVILSWPHRSIREFALRLSLALPAMAVLLAIDAPLELLGNFRHEVLIEVDPHGFQPMFIWDKFLEGGGNCVLALAFAAMIIKTAASLTPGTKTRRPIRP
jgi:hypothetical protein